MRDLAVRMFVDGIEGISANRFKLPEIDDAVSELANSVDDDLPNVAEGYSLTARNYGVRHSEKAKEYLEHLFDDGIRTGRKYTEDEAEAMMRSARNADGTRTFLPDERLNARQIKSYFSYLARKREKVSRPKRDSDGAEGECSQYEEEFEDNLVFEDGSYKNSYDLIAEFIYNNLDRFFEVPDNLDTSEGLQEELTELKIFMTPSFEKQNAQDGTSYFPSLDYKIDSGNGVAENCN